MSDLQDVRIGAVGADQREALIRLQFASWSKAYSRVLPASFIENELEDELKRHWSDAFADESGLVCLGALQDGTLIGFSSLYMNRGGSAFLDNLHVRPDITSRGVGSRLMRYSLHISREHGKTSLHLWVLDENYRAREFYRRHGGVEGNAEIKMHFGQPLNAIRVDFPELDGI